MVGFPLVLLEVALGQHTGLTGLAAIGKAAPVLKGIGFSILITNIMYNIYSPAMIISWAATYFFQSFSNIPDLPWTEGCGKSSASLNCSSIICCQVLPPMQSCRVTHVILNDLSIVHFAPNDFHNFQ